MRFLVDAQLPPALASWLNQHGHAAKAVRELGLRDASDKAIWKFSHEDSCIIVTKDEDFVERTLRSNDGPQILWLRIGNCTNRVLFAWLEPLLPAILRELQTGVRIVEAKRTIT